MKCTTKLSAAIAHLNGQKVVGAEAFTGEPQSARWQEVFPAALNPEDIQRHAATWPATYEPFPFTVEIIREKNPGLLFLKNGSYELVRANDKVIPVVVSGLPDDLVLSTGWTVDLPPGHGAPARIQLSRHLPLNEHPDPGVRYFSGTAIYQRSFVLTPAYLGKKKRLFLDLGRVEAIAEIWVNSRNLGVLWKRPYRMDITNFVKGGLNQLEVRATNLWPNRLIGDAQLPDVDEYIPGAGAIQGLPEWYMKGQPQPENGQVTFATWKRYSPDAPLLDAGLTGPVSVCCGWLGVV